MGVTADTAVPRRQRWTIDQDDRLLDWYESGVPYAEIAARLGRTYSGVTMRQFRLVRRFGGVDHFTTTEIASIVGASRPTVVHWLDRGWLAGQRGGIRKGRVSPHGHRDGRVWYISRDQLRAFLGDQRYFGFWFVENMQPGHWRVLAAELRGGARLITTAQAGRLLGYTSASVINRIRSGDLPAVRGTLRRADGWMGHGTWYVRADLIPSGWSPPPMRCNRARGI